MLLYVYVPLSRSRHRLTELAHREALSSPFYTEREKLRHKEGDIFSVALQLS